MSLAAVELKRVVSILGHAGAIAGLRASDISEDDLRELAKRLRIDRCDKLNRDQLIDSLVRATRSNELKPIEELMQMTYDELIQYFDETAPSNSALLNIMRDLDYKVSAEDRKHLRKYAARQISETALFSDVARNGDRKRIRDRDE